MDVRPDGSTVSLSSTSDKEGLSVCTDYDNDGKLLGVKYISTPWFVRQASSSSSVDEVSPSSSSASEATATASVISIGSDS